MKENNKIIAELLLRFGNFDVSKYDDLFLTKTLDRRVEELKCNSHNTYYDYFEQNHAEVDKFINSLSISYSEFFRNSLTFSVLERVILPSMIFNKIRNKKHEIRIWSAACAAGQESYSLAMLLQEYASNENISFRIFATDQSDEQIQRAQLGSYHLSELGCLSIRRLERWFDKRGDSYNIKEVLKEQIEFSAFDFLSDDFTCPPTSIFGDFDLIICANVLFYYNAEMRKKIIYKIKNSLSNDGFMITGETEREILMQYNFQEVYPQSAIFK